MSTYSSPRPDYFDELPPPFPFGLESGVPPTGVFGGVFGSGILRNDKYEYWSLSKGLVGFGFNGSNREIQMVW